MGLSRKYTSEQMFLLVLPIVMMLMCLSNTTATCRCFHDLCIIQSATHVEICQFFLLFMRGFFRLLFQLLFVVRVCAFHACASAKLLSLFSNGSYGLCHVEVTSLSMGFFLHSIVSPLESFAISARAIS